jgi:hypothetical protein
MAFNIFTTQRVSRFGQYDRIDDLVPFNLRGDKRPVVRQFLVNEFHLSAIAECFDPFFVEHFCISSGEFSECREYTSFGARNRATPGRNLAALTTAREFESHMFTPDYRVSSVVTFSEP